MGLFNDNVSTQRTGQLYIYKGRTLLPSAEKLYRDFLAKETKARNGMAEYMKNMQLSQDDPRIVQARRDITAFGTLKEQCSVFKHEFKRNPDKDYELGLGDVTFFEMNENEN